jgi:hypothetical protein
MPKQLSGATKKKKRKRENQLIESQRGALNKYFPSTSSVDINNNNQRQESHPGQDDEHNTNADLEVNDQSLDNSK